MNYKLGDFVRFVDENLEGYITRIIDKDTLGVTDANDFEIPVLASKVTLVHGDLPKEEEGEARRIPATPEAEFISDGVYLAIVADQHSASVAHFNLVNETSFQLAISFNTQKDQKFKGEFLGIVPPNSSKRLYSAQLADIQIWPKFRVEILFHTSANIEPKKMILYDKAIKGKDLSVAKTNISLLNQKGWLIRLDEDQTDPILDPEKLKQSFYK